MSIQCTICLTALNIKDDTVHTTNCGHVFHRNCLQNALRMTRQCPQCRKANVQHFQLFLTVADDDEEGAVGMSKDIEFLSQQMSQISKKLDNLSGSMTSGRSTGTSTAGRSQDHPILSTRPRENADPDLLSRLQQENQDLREILEMEKILSTNTEQEIDQLKLEVRERNDLINALQGENDNLRDELILYGTPRRRVPTENILDL